MNVVCNLIAVWPRMEVGGACWCTEKIVSITPHLSLEFHTVLMSHLTSVRKQQSISLGIICFRYRFRPCFFWNCLLILAMFWVGMLEFFLLLVCFGLDEPREEFKLLCIVFNLGKKRAAGGPTLDRAGTSAPRAWKVWMCVCLCVCTHAHADEWC